MGAPRGDVRVVFPDSLSVCCSVTMTLKTCVAGAGLFFLESLRVRLQTELTRNFGRLPMAHSASSAAAGCSADGRPSGATGKELD